MRGIGVFAARPDEYSRRSRKRMSSRRALRQRFHQRNTTRCNVVDATGGAARNLREISHRGPPTHSRAASTLLACLRRARGISAPLREENSDWFGAAAFLWPDATAAALPEIAPSVVRDSPRNKMIGPDAPGADFYPNRRLRVAPRPRGRRFRVNCMPDSPPPSSPPTDAFFAAIVNSSSDAIISKDLNGTITSWNTGAHRLFGYTAAETLGRPISLLYPPARLQEAADILQRVRRGETIAQYETVRRHKDGTLLDITLTVSPIVDSTGKIIGASKIARDVTAERREQERLRVTLSSIGDAVMSTDEHGRVVFMNPTAEQLTGWQQAEALGQPLENIFHIVAEHDRQPVPSPVAIALRDNRVVGLANHTVLIAKNHTEYPVDDSAAPIRDSRGNLIGGVLVFRDVSARRDAELTAERLAAIVNGSDDAIVSKNLQGIVMSWNPAAERIFGYTAQEMIGQSITRVLPADRLNEEQQILARLQRGDRVDHFQTLRRRKDGRLIHVSLTISPIRDKDGVIVGASKIARDITELKAAYEKLESHAAELETRVRERTAKLQETVSELEAFSYSLSHDMRAPLRAIQSFSEIVLADYGDKIPEGAEYLRKVIAAANRMDRLIRDVLNFARISRTDIQLSPVNVDELVSDILRERPELQEPRAAVQVERPLLHVLGHDASLTQCLTNLLDNAVKFVAPGVKPSVRVHTERRGDRVRICIADNGIGIDATGQQQLFGMFQRLNPAQGYRGTGVGLAIVRRAAERMQGTAGVESAPGLGSTFWVELGQA
jgi:PAS domain S-box-containing protein